MPDVLLLQFLAFNVFSWTYFVWLDRVNVNDFFHVQNLLNKIETDFRAECSDEDLNTKTCSPLKFIRTLISVFTFCAFTVNRYGLLSLLCWFIIIIIGVFFIYLLFLFVTKRTKSSLFTSLLNRNTSESVLWTKPGFNLATTKIVVSLSSQWLLTTGKTPALCY